MRKVICLIYYQDQSNPLIHSLIIYLFPRHLSQPLNHTPPLTSGYVYYNTLPL